MKKLLNLALLMVILTMGYSQTDPQYSFNMFNHMAINPGFAGANGGICARAIFHEQWMGFENNPRTMVLSADMAMPNISSGVGINVLSDNVGFNTSTYFNANYAYRLKVGDDGDLGLGLGLGLIQNSLSAEWITSQMLYDENAAPTDDPTISTNQEPHIAFDANFGLFYHTTFDKYNEMYAGISATHLTKPKFSTNEDVKANYMARTYYLDAGYYYTMPNGVIQLRPSVLVKTDFITTQFSANLTALYNQMFWAGLTYRANNDLGLMVGATLKNNLSFGIAYEYGLGMDFKNKSSFDVMLKYCFSITKSKGKTSYKSVRFL
ncbi:MAG: PorP/SprF family type IX secretion system membrane protein [Bacteroidales bacterium]|nr:PorP/SprF family type IX secretion system membrane protein [Bacteroidales bacterium]